MTIMLTADENKVESFKFVSKFVYVRGKDIPILGYSNINIPI